MSRHTSGHKHTNRQVPRGKKRPRGYGQQITSAEEIMDRLRTQPPRPPRYRRRSNGRPNGRVGSRP